MASWRSAVSQQAQDDLDSLLDTSLEPAQHFLEKNGEFYPFAMTTSLSGEIAMIGADTGGELPPSQDVMDMLVEGIRDRRDELRAYALVYDVRLAEKNSDAICISAEHSEGVALEVVIPYSKKRFGRGFAYGDLGASLGSMRVWRSES